MNATKSDQNEHLLSTRFAFGGAPGEVMRNHFWRDANQARLSAKFKLYYRLRPFIPIPLRQLLQRERNQAIDAPAGWYFPSRFVTEFRRAVQGNAEANAIHPWPDGYEMSVVLTHDVETKDGATLVDKLAALEESYGFRSSWNFIPYKYKVDSGLLTDLKNRGHEIGVHGYNHDGRLFESRRTFDRRSGPINRALRQYGSCGFRAPMVHRNLQWLQSLNVDYDSSCFDVDPFQAMPGGVGSVWPFLAGKFVELPYTLPQDHTLLISLGETTPRIWIEKLDYLRTLAGMAMLITHPDYLDNAARIGVYERFLIHLAAESGCWHTLPQQLAHWWRHRDKLELIETGESVKIIGPLSERARSFALAEFLLPLDETESMNCH